MFQLQKDLPTLTELRTKALDSLNSIRQDHKRALNPTPYKVCIYIQFQHLIRYVYPIPTPYKVCISNSNTL